MVHATRVICFTLLLTASSSLAAAEEFTEAIHAFLQQRVEVEKRDVGIVVGLVDEHGSSVISCGKLDNGTDQEVNGDTVFEIGSVTKTFTGLLLQDMVERVQMKLDDPVAKYLPESVKMPTRNGKEITLLQLATHTSGLPTTSVTWTPKRAENPRAEYTIERMYDFVSGYQLTRDPGTKYEYSTVGMALLGQAIALKAGTSYESLVVDRICRPLAMDSTRITLTPELKDRFATGHNAFGYAVSGSYWGALTAGAALRSTAHDLLKYVSANLGLTPSGLTPLMEKTHVAHFHAGRTEDSGLDTDTDIGLDWMITRDRQGAKIVQHGGLTDGFITFVCFDLTRRRGVVVLSSSQGFDVGALGRLLLASEWQSDQRPQGTKISSESYDPYVGQYQESPVDDAPSPSVIGIRREGGRLFSQTTGSRSRPLDVLWPPLAAELLPESADRFFNRLTGMRVTFFRDDRGKVIRLTAHTPGADFSLAKTSDQPPQAPAPPKPHVAIKLGTKLLDTVVGQYEFAPGVMFPKGAKITTWREGDQLVGQFQGENTLAGAFEIYAESETSFFVKLNGTQLTFLKDGTGEVTAVVHHSPRAGVPDREGKKVK
jgi:CubicO group peptidase (beta-lactamase class C family)